jgi:hypothetical protein
MKNEDAGEIAGVLGNTTSSAYSDLLLNDKGDDKDYILTKTFCGSWMNY